MPLTVLENITEPARLLERDEVDYLVFYASIDPTHGQMWCGDCRRVEEVVRRVFDDAGSPSAAIVYVGSKPEWKNPSSAFRGEPFTLTDVPTIAKLERDGNGNVGIVKLVDTEIDAGLPAFVAGGRGVAEGA
ncbi:N-acetyltransferase domain-containing protein [Mycena chlorophos]|uniref:N-acetyltransferase domain-containing protein n=1 Tax=Mycena chlorophos TaxID=658473 RepID=A0A8H6T5B8_MYCCL|nr:N-acetyltransferase domain-containing protein [Mycena chlorophos]